MIINSNFLLDLRERKDRREVLYEDEASLYETLKAKTDDELKNINVTVLGRGQGDTIDGKTWCVEYQLREAVKEEILT